MEQIQIRIIHVQEVQSSHKLMIGYGQVAQTMHLENQIPYLPNHLSVQKLVTQTEKKFNTWN